MSVPIEMPKLSDTMTEGTVVKWHKKPGDEIAIGDVLADIETDKATMEMEAFDEGVLGEIYVQEGNKAPVGEKLAILLVAGEKAGTPEAPKAAAPKAPAPTEAKSEKSAAPVAAPKAKSAASGNGRIKVSPLAKKIAAERGVELDSLTGSGPGGRIVQRDVLGAKATGPAKAAPPAPSAAPAVPAMKAGDGDQRIPLSGMRKTIAERLVASKTQIPHFYLNIEVDAAELMKLRGEINVAAEKAGQAKLTVNDFVLRAAIVAVTKVPKVNAAWDNDAIIQYASVNLAVAVAIDDGLVTPVIRGAHSKGLREISEAVKDLATRARSKKLKPDEYQGGTLTVSNLGSYGIESFSAIINPPQSMILSVGAIVKKPVVNAKNEIVVGQRMNIGLSCDHRVVDGALGALYLGELRRLIENPALMLL